MSSSKCFHVSRGGSCKLPSCDHKRVELQIVDWSGCEGTGRDESFDVSTWTPQQFEALRSFIATGCGRLALPADHNQNTSFTQYALPVMLEELKQIKAPHLRLFHLVHTVFGPDLITHFYAKTTIRDYRRALRGSGFDYPRYHRYGPAQKDVFLTSKAAGRAA